MGVMNAARGSGCNAPVPPTRSLSMGLLAEFQLALKIAAREPRHYFAGIA